MSTVLKQIIAFVKQEPYYVPRAYQTIGGMWTVDTWQRAGVSVKVMDEGYTTVVEAPQVRVIDGVRGIEFEKGSEEQLQQLWEQLSEPEEKKAVRFRKM